MNSVDAYLQVYKVLEEYYFSTDEYYDNLGAMLGDMDTTVWVPAEGEALVSGDPAVFAEDWTNAWKRIVGEGGNGTERQVFWVAKNLLDYYTQQVDYDLGDAETYLKERLGLVRMREHKAS
ncbi:MAG: hypothetical protein LBL86_03955 [Coriobacteriales bacterium]|jgi:hypothetical protein|nr:hypothetical protein [Coriobacteriales bacterium]